MSGSAGNLSRRPEGGNSKFGFRVFHHWTRPLGVLLIVSLVAAICHAETVSVSKLDLRKIQQARGPRGGFRGARPTTPVPISIAGQTFEDGVKTFGSSTLWIDLGQKAKRLGRFQGRRPDWKKAIVTLRKGDVIELV